MINVDDDGRTADAAKLGGTEADDLWFPIRSVAADPTEPVRDAVSSPPPDDKASVLWRGSSNGCTRILVLVADTGDVGGLRMSAGSKNEYTFDRLDVPLACDSVMDTSSMSDAWASSVDVDVSL